MFTTLTRNRDFYIFTIFEFFCFLDFSRNLCRSRKNTKTLSGEPPRDLEKYAFLLEGMLRTRFGLSGPDSLRRAGKRGRGSASPRVGSLSGLPVEPRGSPNHVFSLSIRGPSGGVKPEEFVGGYAQDAMSCLPFGSQNLATCVFYVSAIFAFSILLILGRFGALRARKTS